MSFKQFIENSEPPLKLTSNNFKGNAGYDDIKAKTTRVKSAIAKVVSIGFINPINGREIILNQNVAISLHAHEGNLWIDTIRAFDQKKGIGTNTMQLLCRIADEFNVDMSLFAVPFGTKKPSVKKLVEFYKRFGFVKDDNGMTRKSQAIS